MNEISIKRDKQTQQAYRPCYELVTAILGPFFEKYGWIAASRLLNWGRSLAGWQTKPNKPNDGKRSFINEIS